MTALLEELPLLLQDLFLDLPDALNDLLEVPFCQRQRVLTPSTFVRTLVFGWLDNPHATTADLADYATTLGAPLSESGLRQHFTPAAVALLQGVLEQALYHLPLGALCDAPLLRRFAGVYAFDSTTVALPACLARALPGCGNHTGTPNAAAKVLLGLELTSGALAQLDLVSARQPDQQLIPHGQPLPSGALRLRALGFFSLEDLAWQHEQGVFYLTRAHPQLVVQLGDGQSQSLLAFVRARGPLVDERVTVGSKCRLRCRLLAWRVPDAVAQRRREKRLAQYQRKKRRRRKKQQRGGKVGGRPPRLRGGGPTAEQLEQCDWVMVLTNVPEEQLSVAEAETLLRARWQIELLIKVWKGAGALESIRARRAERGLCELLAKLLGQVVQHWAVLSSGWVYVEAKVTRGARQVRKYAERLGQALGQGVAALEAVLQELHGRLQRMGKRRRGRQRPSTRQRLEGELPPLFADAA